MERIPSNTMTRGAAFAWLCVILFAMAISGFAGYMSGCRDQYLTDMEEAAKRGYAEPFDKPVKTTKEYRWLEK